MPARGEARPGRPCARHQPLAPHCARVPLPPSWRCSSAQQPVTLPLLPRPYLPSSPSPCTPYPPQRCLEEALVHAFVEARRAAPALLYLPHLPLWWATAPGALRAALLMLLDELPAELPLLLVAVADCPARDLEPEVRVCLCGGRVAAGGGVLLVAVADCPSLDLEPGVWWGAWGGKGRQLQEGDRRLAAQSPHGGRTARPHGAAA